MLKHRCAGLLFCLLACLPLSNLTAQTPEDLLEAGDYVAAAKAFTDRNTRIDHLAAGEAWDAADSLHLALIAYESAAAGFIDSLAGLAHHRIGLLHFNTYEEAKAVGAYQQAVKIRDQAFSGPHKDRAHSRLNLAQVLIILGQNDTATIILQQAIDLYTRAQPTDSLNWIRAYNSLALLSEDARDYQVGINAIQQATAMIEQQPNPDPLDVYDAWYAAGRTYLVFNELLLAEAATQRALKAAEDSGYQYEISDALVLAASIAKELGNYEKSLNLHLRAMELGQDLGVPEEDTKLLHFNLALLYGKLGKPALALSHSNQAAPLLQDDKILSARLQSVRGDIYRSTEEYQKAERAFNQGIGIVAGLTGEAFHRPSPAGMEPRELEVVADLLGDRAEVFTALGNSQQALKDYNLLFDVLDNLRNRVTSDESRRYLSKNLRPFFDRAIALEFVQYIKQPDPAIAWRAFALSERAKAYSLLTAIQQDRASMPRREAELRTRIAALERSATPGSEEVQLLAAARLQLDRLLRLNVKETSQSIPPFDQQKIEAFLREQKTNLLAFHLGVDQGFRWWLQPDGSLQFSKVENVTELPTTINRWRAAITQSAYRRKSLRPAEEQRVLDASFLENGRQLYRQLIGATTFNGRVCVLPDGPLLALPFGALPAQDATLPLAYGQLEYLQNTAVLHYAYSARVWLELAEKPAANYEHNLLAFAPTFRGSSPAKNLSRAIRIRNGERAISGLSPLQYNQPEVQEITALVGHATAFYGADADRQHFLDNLSGARIIHLSTHGVVNAADPALSFVAFSQLGDSLQYEEMLYYNDLSALPITTELAVLSACETSLGTYVPGETSLSLASAFTAAGARSTLTTLWQVDDAATKELVVNFYQEIAAGKDRVTALMAAQRAHQNSEDYAHPFYWSALTLFGEAGPLPLASAGLSEQLDWLFTPYFPLALVVVTGLFLFLRKQALTTVG